MTSALLLASLVAAAPPSGGPAARVFLEAAAGGAPGCATTKGDGGLVVAELFSSGSELCPVARVGDEVIALGELAGAVEFMHLDRMPRGRAGKAPALDFRAPLDRLIDSRLILQEAREMQLDQAPEIRKEVESFRSERLRRLVQETATRDARPAPAEVERLYRDAVREWKLRSILVDEEDDAKAFQAEIAKGKRFDAAAAEWVKAKKAKGGEPAAFAPRKQMLPEVVEAVRTARQGDVVGPVKVPAGFVLLQVQGVRYPVDAKLREEARGYAQSRADFEAVRKLYETLVARHARVDRALLDALDFEKDGEKGFVALMEDGRTLVAIDGESPITVGDLTRAVSEKFFHGLETPISQHKVNPEKQPAFERLLGARLFAKQAGLKKLERDPALVRDVAGFERMRVFNTFVEKVIVPDVVVTEPDAMGWYEEHKARFSSPEMYKLDGLAFPTSAAAQAALDKLKAGTNFGWYRSNAPGQLDAARCSLQFDGQTLSLTGMPPGLAKAVAGSGEGDYRLYAASAREVYVVRVVSHAPPTPQPYLKVREDIVKQLFAERLSKGIQDYAGKLRAAQKVEILITGVKP